MEAQEIEETLGCVDRGSSPNPSSTVCKIRLLQLHEGKSLLYLAKIGPVILTVAALTALSAVQLKADRQTDHNRIHEAGDANARSSPSLYAICARYISNVESK